MASVCRDCGGELVEGYLLDRDRVVDGATMWVEGKHESGALGGVRLADRSTFDVVALRCRDCGTLTLRTR